MKCPKCGTELWKVNIAHRHRIAGKGFVAVNINCSKCGHNAHAYVVHKDLVVINKQLDSINEMLLNTLSLLKQKKKDKSKGKSIWGWIRGAGGD